MAHSATATPHATDDHAADGVHVHVMPIPVLIGVWAALMVFTVITVAMSYINLGAADLIVVMVIATIKASLVGLYFMHLRYDKPFNSLVFLSSLLFMGFFIIVSLTDTFQYRPLINLNLLQGQGYDGQPPMPTVPAHGAAPEAHH